jgi:hypothetical protein
MTVRSLAADRTEAALKRGVDELQSRLEYTLRNRPRALKYARERYVEFALVLFRAIERAEE